MPNPFINTVYLYDSVCYNFTHVSSDPDTPAFHPSPSPLPPPPIHKPYLSSTTSYFYAIKGLLKQNGETPQVASGLPPLFQLYVYGKNKNHYPFSHHLQPSKTQPNCNIVIEGTLKQYGRTLQWLLYHPIIFFHTFLNSNSSFVFSKNNPNIPDCDVLFRMVLMIDTFLLLLC